MNEELPTRPTRLAIVISHPIQHFVPFYRAIAKERSIELKVFFCSRIGSETFHDPEMGVSFKWDADFTSGYDYDFLPEADRIVSISFSSVDNPSIGAALTAFVPDAVMVSGYAQKTALRALFWSRKRGIPVLMASDGYLGGKYRSLVGWAARACIFCPLLAQASAFLTVGDENERMYAHFGVSANRMFRTPLPIDENLFLRVRDERTSRRARLRSELRIGEADLVFLSIGKLSPRKRPGDFVEATLQLGETPRDERVFAVLCGDGAERDALALRVAGATERIRLAGFVNLDRLPDFYAAADILVHPSEADPHPLACSEAACVGLPMIVSDHVGAIGPTDIARPAKNTIVYPCGDIGALAGAMRRLASHPELRASMSAASVRIYGECGMAASLAGLQAALDAVVRARRIGAARIPERTMMNEQSSTRPTRLGIVVSHPIQYSVWLYEALARNKAIELRVFFCTRLGQIPYPDSGMGVMIQWAGRLTDGYDHVFLPGGDAVSRISFSSVDNPSITSALSSFRPDAIITNGYSLKTILRALFWAAKHRIPALLVSDSSLRNERLTPAKRLFKKPVLKLILKFYTAFLTSGDENEAYLRAYGVSPSAMFRSPFTIDELTYRAIRAKRASVRAKVRQELGIHESAFVVLSVGKLQSFKRTEDTVNAVGILSERVKDRSVVHLIAGDGDQRAQVEAAIVRNGNRSTLLGFVNIDGLPSLYAASDVLVHASELENRGMIFYEAACVGLPIICTSASGAVGASDIVRPGENAMVFEPRRVDEVVEHLWSLYRDQGLYAALARRSLEIFEENSLARAVEGVHRALSYVNGRRSIQ